MDLREKSCKPAYYIYFEPYRIELLKPLPQADHHVLESTIRLPGCPFLDSLSSDAAEGRKRNFSQAPRHCNDYIARSHKEMKMCLYEAAERHQAFRLIIYVKQHGRHKDANMKP